MSRLSHVSNPNALHINPLFWTLRAFSAHFRRLLFAQIFFWQQPASKYNRRKKNSFPSKSRYFQFRSMTYKQKRLIRQLLLLGVGQNKIYMSAVKFGWSKYGAQAKKNRSSDIIAVFRPLWCKKSHLNVRIKRLTYDEN